jgi:uncharacterized membrane protein YukC
MDREHRKEVLHIKNEQSVFGRGTRDYLIFPNELLVPATVSEYEDAFDLELDARHLYDFDEIRSGEETDKYRLLIACGKLERLRIDYAFSISPGNLMYDINFIPKVKLRDGAAETDDFLEEYKALVSCVIHDRYTYEDYYGGGMDLYEKNGLTRAVFAADCVAAIVDLLRETFDRLKGRGK